MDFKDMEFSQLRILSTPEQLMHKQTAENENEDEDEVPISRPKTLRHLALDAIIGSWSDNPIFEELQNEEDRNYLLSHLDVNLPLKTLSAHISDDCFWRKCYQHRWMICYFQPMHKSLPSLSSAPAKPWINIYMERHLQEFIENLQIGDYDAERLQAELDICATYINQLEISHLQAAVDGKQGPSDHIPLDFILSNLPELRTLRLTYATKTIGTNFYLGCNTMTQNDTLHLAKGLSECYELRSFCLHSTKLESYQLKILAHDLDKGCHNLTTLKLVHCHLGDEGITQFLQGCHKESFATLKELNLTNNFITSKGAYNLNRTLLRLNLERLILRFNPIGNDGAAAILSLMFYLPIKHLDISSCDLNEDILQLFVRLIKLNTNLIYLDISNNVLGEEFGQHLYEAMPSNEILQQLDLRNTGIPIELRNKFKQILLRNKAKLRPMDYFKVF